MMTIQITVSHFMEESERGEKNGKERDLELFPLEASTILGRILLKEYNEHSHFLHKHSGIPHHS